MRTLMVLVLVVVSAPVWAQANRPQTPVEPFPYEEIEVVVPVHDHHKNHTNT